MNKLDPTYRGILSVDDIRKAVEALKKIDPAKRVEIGSIDLMNEVINRTGKTTFFTSIFGVPLRVDDSVKPDEYKIVYASGKEETHKWRNS